MKAGPSFSIRLEMLREVSALASQLDIRIPEFCIISHGDVDRLSRSPSGSGAAPELAQELALRTQVLNSDEIFARAQPLDESLAPHLSFAGIYQSYAPRRNTSRRGWFAPR